MPDMPRRAFRADDETWDKARKLAHDADPLGISVSEWIREAIHNSYREKFPMRKRREGGKDVRNL